jgi:hypothetical protein
MCTETLTLTSTVMREWSIRHRSCAGRHGVKYQQNGADRRIELFVCDVRVSFRFDGLAVVNVAQRAFHPPFERENYHRFIISLQANNLISLSPYASDLTNDRWKRIICILSVFFVLLVCECHGWFFYIKWRTTNIAVSEQFVFWDRSRNGRHLIN